MKRLYVALRTLGLPSLALGALGALAGCSSGDPCAAGAEACTCRASTPACDDGLGCTNGTCTKLDETALSISSADARACDVLVEDAGVVVEGAAFTGATGQVVREAPQTAISFFAASDAPFAAGAVRLRTRGTGTPRVVSATCFDAAGRALANVTVRVGA
ncbi:hypothetical protein L6R52_26525 [Myxococcota bacterium]|nr:hypothetical protein [Myxococcota bacterium]